MNLRNQALSGAKWLTIHYVFRFVVTFIMSIFLARTLELREFGLMGMISVFIGLSDVFINSGFSNAIIRTKNTSDRDHSSVFYMNIGISLCLYCLLFISAPFVSNFYGEHELINIIRVVCVVIVINSTGLVHNALIVKRMDFRSQTIAALLGLIISSVIALSMAFRGYGVYSIVGQAVSQATVKTLGLWLFSKWKPQGVFSRSSLKKLWPFSSRVLASNVITSFSDQFDNITVGKLFNAYNLGIYGRGRSTSQIPQGIFSGVIGAASFSVFSQINDDLVELKRVHIRFFKLSVFVVFPLIFGLIASAEAFIVGLYTEKWSEAVPMVQLVSITAITEILGNFFSQTVMALGNAGLYLKLNTYKKLTGLLAIPFGIYFGIYPFVIALVSIRMIGLLIDFFFVQRLLHFNKGTYVRLMFKPLLNSLIMGVVVFGIGEILNLNALLILCIQAISGILLYAILAKAIDRETFQYMTRIIKEKINSYKSK